MFGKQKQFQEEPYEKLIKDLKNLPKIETPKDFEYKLMVQIQNGEFGKNKNSRESNFFWKVVPALTLGLSAIVLFIIFQQSSSDTNYNYLPDEPQKYTSDYSLKDTFNVSTNVEQNKTKKESYRVLLNNDAIVKQKIQSSDLEEETGISLDNFISGKNKFNSNSDSKTLVRNRISFPDYGFLIPVENNEKSATSKQDSLKELKNKKK